MRRAIDSGIDSHRLLGGLKTLDRWHCWRAIETDDGFQKKPVNLDSFADGTSKEPNIRDPEHWLSYAEARENLAQNDELDGLQIFIDVSSDDIVIIDFDDCVDPETGKIDPPVREFLRMTDTYAELSPSGTGLHMVLRGTIDRQGWDSAADVDGEIYDKYIVSVTQNHIAGTSYRAKQAPEVLEKYFEVFDVSWDGRLL